MNIKRLALSGCLASVLLVNTAFADTFSVKGPIQIAAGGSHTCAVFDDHSLKCWGRNINGQLGLENTNGRGAQAGQLGDNLPAVNVGAGRSVLSVVAGQNHTCALLDNYSVKCWGDNSRGQLGSGSIQSVGGKPNEMGDKLPVVDLGKDRTALNIAAGALYTCAILDDHSLKCWGANNTGQLGIGTAVDRGRLAKEMGDSLPIVQLGTGRTVEQVAPGTLHTCAILDDHSLKCWGRNLQGQLGLGDKVSRGAEANQMGDLLQKVNLGTGRSPMSVYVGSAHTCALLDNQSIKCWGDNSLGQLGAGDIEIRGTEATHMGDQLPEVNLDSGDLGIVGMSMGYAAQFQCAYFFNGTAKCWGSNFQGQLGAEDIRPRGISRDDMGENLPFVNLGVLASVTRVTSGTSHSCAILDDGSLKCWGENGSGQLGLGDAKRRGHLPATMGESLPKVSL